MIIPLAVLLVFISVSGLVLAFAWSRAAGRSLQTRLATTVAAGPQLTVIAEKKPESAAVRALHGTGIYDRLALLCEQAGDIASINTVVSTMVAAGLLALTITWSRTGIALWAIIAAFGGGAAPVAYLLYRRMKRMRKFEAQFPDALDAMARALRAGYALAGGIQLVGEEMADPVGHEMRRIFEETRLGVDANDALTKLNRRVPSDDVAFFCMAVRVQRGTGGNLAEVFDRISEVMRERFKLLSHARAVSSQQRYGAVCIGLSPLALGLIMRLFNPRYFDPLLESVWGPTLLVGGLVLELVGFFIIWRMAQIKV